MKATEIETAHFDWLALHMRSKCRKRFLIIREHISGLYATSLNSLSRRFLNHILYFRGCLSISQCVFQSILPLDWLAFTCASVPPG
jgi:hypothetical protein